MNLKCPFAAPLTKGDFGCSHAREVVRRGGSEYDCGSAPDHARCSELFDGLKRVSLPAFQVDDDLTSMPHSVLVKIQYGGLLGLERLARGETPAAIEDISTTIMAAEQRYGSLEGIPYTDLVDAITGFKLQRRTRRR